MKNREELITHIYDVDDFGQDDPEGAIESAVNETVDAILEYVDNDVKQYADHYAVLGQVLSALRNNIAQLKSNA